VRRYVLDMVVVLVVWCVIVLFQAEEGIRGGQESRGLGEV